MDIDGIKILNWVRNSEDDIFAQSLKGCTVSNDVSEWILIDVTQSHILVKDEIFGGEPTKKNLNFLSDKTIHIPDDIQLLIENNKGNLDRLEDETDAVLKRFNISRSVLGGGASEFKVAKILMNWELRQFPSPDDQYVLYEICSNIEKPSIGLINLFKTWKEITEKEFNRKDALLRLNLAVLYRKAGKLKDALSETDDERNFICSNHIRAMICCDRAAIYLDIYENKKDQESLDMAMKYLKKSYANEKSHQVSNCWTRYNALVMNKNG